MAHVRTVDRKTGTAYEVRWRDNGKFKQRSFTVKRDANRFALKIENTRAAGESTEPFVKNSKTFREIALASLAASAPRLKPKTHAGYADAYRLHIYPAFGQRRVSSITSLEIEDWLREMETKLSPKTGKPYATASVRGAMIALSKAFGYAVKHRLIAANPCDVVDMPRKKQSEPVFLTPPQVEAVAAELDRYAPYGLIVRFAAWSGLRAGELAALRIRDVNFLRRHVEVRRTVQRVNGGWQFGTPKTTRSSRDVPLRRELLAELAAYLEIHPLRHDPDAGLWPGRVQGGNGLAKSALDFDRQFDVASLSRYYFHPALERLGVPHVRWHDLRHFYASACAGAGIDIYKVSRWMGHSNVAITDGIYTHLFNGDHDSDMDKLESMAMVNRAATAPRSAAGY